ncbi:hypothetical protein TBLA_0C01120 [Henningerozyma blattae CBS 6284]|uniref:Zn(2)-C6 fungal-type domain-containing protein n=1 Tax=Henningerozyma blattae (strain ATCC 34711 / CBS 6284 / DSM 70876 / NBRC 10599 / NRRL Y-10934 / UCD 77-7) TaxID=1071380 RepID=I2H0M5_HENB6|nr:hypothetical protein TBLA_0C01120 [Tetrapisispora blattae CBS 6284]CCH59927.1 hypothetical protein TBLA_0C01120 [Tetrapisispora blattae CBS 6284]
MNKQTERPKRKRNRIPLSCTICRKRKVKCDKTHPYCVQCTKTGMSHLCHYMEQSWAQEAELIINRDVELKQLRERVKLLEDALASATTTASYNNNPDYNSKADHTDTTGHSEPIELPSDSNDSHDSSDSSFDTSNNSDTTTSIILSKKKNEKKTSSVIDHIDITKQFAILHIRPKSIVHLGVTHWMAMMRGDPYLKVLWNQIFMMQGAFMEWSNRNNKCVTNNIKTMKNNLHTSSVFSESPPIQVPGPSSSSSKSILAKNNPSNLSFKDPLTAIVKLLPPKNIIQLFLDRFFKHLYSIIPILDEVSFKHSIAIILDIHPNSHHSPSNDNSSSIKPTSNTSTNSIDVSSIKLRKSSDFYNFAILIIILRLTWLSLPSNSYKIKLPKEYYKERNISTSINQKPYISKDEHILVNYEISSEAIELAAHKLIKFDELRTISNDNINLSTVQFAIFFKLYLLSTNDSSTLDAATSEDIKTKSLPKESPSPTSSATNNNLQDVHQVLLSSIIQMAFSCGLHRDPDNFPQLSSSISSHHPEVSHNTESPSMNTATGTVNSRSYSPERYKHSWRKTWYYIVSLDIQQSLQLGTPRNLRNLHDFSDTKLPASSKIDYVRDIKELLIVKNFSLFFQIDLCIISVLNQILNVSKAKDVTRKELEILISALNDLILAKRPIKEIINSLVDNGLLYQNEGALNLNDNITAIDENYQLPPLDDLLSYGQTKVDNIHPNETITSDTGSTSTIKRIDVSANHQQATRAVFFSKHLTLRSVLYLLNYLLFTHYEALGSHGASTLNLTEYYAQQTLNLSMDNFQNCFIFFTNYNITKKNSLFAFSRFILTPHCLDMANRSLQVFICIILRATSGPLPDFPNEQNFVLPNPKTKEKIHSQNEKHEILQKYMTLSPIHLNLSEPFLSGILMEKLNLFYQLTKSLSNSYAAARKLMQLTTFFITLLKQSSMDNTLEDTTDYQRPTIISQNKSVSTNDKSFPPIKYINSNSSSYTSLYQHIPHPNNSSPNREPTRSLSIKNLTTVTGSSSISHTPPQIYFKNSTSMPNVSSEHLLAVKSYKPVTFNSNGIYEALSPNLNPSAPSYLDNIKKRKLSVTEPQSTSPPIHFDYTSNPEKLRTPGISQQYYSPASTQLKSQQNSPPYLQQPHNRTSIPLRVTPTYRASQYSPTTYSPNIIQKKNTSTIGSLLNLSSENAPLFTQKSANGSIGQQNHHIEPLPPLKRIACNLSGSIQDSSMKTPSTIGYIHNNNSTQPATTMPPPHISYQSHNQQQQQQIHPPIVSSVPSPYSQVTVSSAPRPNSSRITTPNSYSIGTAVSTPKTDSPVSTPLSVKFTQHGNNNFDFEGFLQDNFNFNRLMVNPNNFCEAVGLNSSVMNTVGTLNNNSQNSRLVHSSTQEFLSDSTNAPISGITNTSQQLNKNGNICSSNSDTSSLTPSPPDSTNRYNIITSNDRYQQNGQNSQLFDFTNNNRLLPLFENLAEFTGSEFQDWN